MAFTIRNLTIENPLILAPMEAVNNASFRLLCRSYGAALVHSPMIDTDHFIQRLKENKDDELETVRQVINPLKQERPLSIQIAGSNISHLTQSVQIIQKYADAIDYNCGCPKSDMLAKKAGAYLLKHTNMLEKYITVLRENTDLPLTCKIRSGWDIASINAVETAKMLEHCGVDAISLHARTRKETRQGKADWDLIQTVKKQITIPLIGNGDISSPKGVKIFLDMTKCDGAMIARAAMGNPFIFSDSLRYLETGVLPHAPSLEQKKEAFDTYYELYQQHELKQKCSELQDHAIWFFSGFRNSSLFKQQILKAKNIDTLIKTVQHFR